jgi:hypothetical protein
LRDMCVQVTLPASIYAAKQHVLTYYMQRDGIVKSIEGLIQQASMPDLRPLRQKLDGDGTCACG